MMIRSVFLREGCLGQQGVLSSVLRVDRACCGTHRSLGAVDVGCDCLVQPGATRWFGTHNGRQARHQVTDAGRWS